MTDTFSEGDLIEATKGDTVIRGRLVPATDKNGDTLPPQPGLWLVVQNWPTTAGATNPRHTATFVDALGLYGWKVTVIERAAPALPTEPGTYVSWVNSPSPTIVHKITDGRWVDADDNEYLPETYIAKLSPLTRMEPEPTAAKKVLDAVAKFAWADGFGPQLEVLRAQFGVTS